MLMINKKRGVYLVVIIISALLISKLLISYQNSRIIDDNVRIQHDAELAKINTLDIIRNAHLLDMGLRGYAIYPDPGIRGSYDSAWTRNDNIFKNLELALHEQHYDMSEVKEMREMVDDYFDVAKEMMSYLESGQREKFDSLFKLDKGYDLWVYHKLFTANVNKFENIIQKEAKENYERALKRNYWILSFMLVLIIPTLFYTTYQTIKEIEVSNNLKKSEEDKNKMLVAHAQTLNRTQHIAKIGSWTFDLKANLLEWSDETYTIFEVKPGKRIRYDDFLSYIHPDDKERVDQSWKNALQGKPHQIEHRIIAGGKVKWVKEQAQIEFDNLNEPVMAIGAVQDITDRKQAEDALLYSEAQLKLQVQRMPLGHIMWSPDFKVLSWNPAAEKIFGFTEQEMIGQHPYGKIVPQEAQAEVNSIWQRLLEGDITTHSTNTNLTKNKSIVICEWANTPLRNAEGNVTTVLSMVNDITERKRAENNLFESERSLNQAQAVSQTGSWRLDVINNKLDWSKEAYNIFEVPAGKALTYDDFLSYIHPDDREYVDISWNAALKGEHYDIEHRIIVNDRIKWVREQALLEFDKVGGLSYGIGTVQDITEKKEAEVELKRSKELAESASRAKTEFLANISHEIRTPMNAILGFSEILVNTQKDKNAQGYLKSIIASGKTLLSLINDLLDLSKIDAGRLELHNSPVQVFDIIEDIREMFRHQYELKSLGFEIIKSEAFPRTITVDEIRLRQILINLVGNAIKFTESGKITLKLHSTPHQEDGFCDLQISVTDTGIGIDETDHELIFESFRQAKDGMVRHFGGTGLGLAITSRLVKLMDGTITLNSKPGEGSTFIVTIPKVECMNRTVVAEDTIKWKNTGMQFQHARVMIVDDIPINVMLIEAFLAEHGLEFITATNGKEAVELAGQLLPDLILMDFQMPVMDGLTATRIIKSSEKTKHIPVIALTAAIHILGEQQENGLFNGYLSKPIGKNTLLKELMKFLVHDKAQILDDAGANKISVTIADDDYEKMKQQAPYLTEHVAARIITLTDVMDLKEMNAFIEDLKSFAHTHQINFLTEIVNLLGEFLEIFDVDSLNNQLKELAKIIRTVARK